MIAIQMGHGLHLSCHQNWNGTATSTATVLPLVLERCSHWSSYWNEVATGTGTVLPLVLERFCHWYWNGHWYWNSAATGTAPQLILSWYWIGAAAGSEH